MTTKRFLLTLLSALAIAIAVGPASAHTDPDSTAECGAALVHHGRSSVSDTTIEIPIAAGTDDAGNDPECDYSTTDPEIYFGQCTNGTEITSGFRFANVTVPQYAGIIAATIRFTVDGPYSEPMTVRFNGEDTGNAQPFSDSSRPDNRPLIADFNADWSITSSDHWNIGEIRTSPSLAQIVQAVVNRSDWTSGNALAIIARTMSTPGGPGAHRRVLAYERSWANGKARLIITYRVLGEPDLVALRALAPPAIDGNLSDWGQWTPILLDKDTAEAVWFQPPQVGPPTLEDSSASLRALWDSSNLYVAVNVRDDAIVNDSSDGNSNRYADRFGFAYADQNLDGNADANTDYDAYRHGDGHTNGNRHVDIDAGGATSFPAADPAALVIPAGLSAARPATSSPVPLLRFDTSLGKEADPCPSNTSRSVFCSSQRCWSQA